MLELVGVTKRENGIPHLEGISHEFAAGKLYVVLGLTGAGKTSLLRAIMGLLELDSGSIMLNGQDITKVPIWKRQMAMVYQQFINYPHLSALENVEFPLRRAGMTRDDAKKKAMAALEAVGLGDLASRRPAELSGGQQQRVAIARSLVKDAKILMLDEPLVNLDYKLREQFRDEIPRMLEKNRGSVILYTTTEPRESMQLGDEILVMSEGRLIQAGTPSRVFSHPANTSVARLISSPPISLFPGAVQGGSVRLEGGIDLELPAGRSVGDGQYVFGVRPDKFALGGRIPATVLLSEINGSETEIHVRTPCGEAIVQQQGVLNFEVGSDLKISFEAEDLFIFDGAGAGNIVSSPLP